MNDYATDAEGMKALQSRLGADCPRGYWDPAGNNVEVVIIPGTPDHKLVMGEGGFAKHRYFWFEALVSSWGFDTAQALKDAVLETTFRYLGDDFKVTDVNIRGGGLKVMVECNSVSQNA